MISISRLIRLIIAGAALWFASAVLAQESPPASPSPLVKDELTPDLTVAEVEAALAAMEADTSIEDAVKGRLRTTYQKAIEALQDTAAFADRAAQFREAIRSAPDRTSALREQLQVLPSAENAAKTTLQGDNEALQAAIEARRVSRDDLKRALAKAKSELSRAAERPYEISNRLPETQRELAGIDKRLASPTLAEEAASPSRTAERVLLQAKRLRLLIEAEMLSQEQSSQSVRDDLLEAEHDLLTRQLENADAVLKALTILAADSLTNTARQFVTRAESLGAQVPDDDEAAQGLATEVQGLAGEFTDAVRHLKQAKRAQRELMAKLERLTTRYEGIQEQLQIGGGGRGMAQVLMDMQQGYGSHLAYVEGLATRVVPIAETRLAELEIRSKLGNQKDLEKRFASQLSKAVARLFEVRRELLDQLRTHYGDLTRALASLEGQKREYLDKAKEVRTYASEQLFGFAMRSTPPIGLQTFAGIPNDLGWFMRAEHWQEFGNALRGMASRRPVLSTGVLLIAVVLLLTRRRMVSALARTAVQVRRASTDRYVYTFQALVWTALLTVPIPLLVGFAGWALGQTPGASAWLRGIVQGLQLATWIGFVLAFLAVVCRPGGLGIEHFRWQAKPLAHFRRVLLWFGVVYVPAVLFTFVGLYEETSYLAGAARLSFMLAHAWTAFMFWQLLNFSRGVLARFMREQPASLIARWRYLWFPLVLAYPLALVVIAGLGYMITAIILSLGLLGTMGYIAAGTVLYRLVRRWFRMKERQLALQEALERRRARQETAAQAPQVAGDVVTVDPDAEEALNLVTIGEQTLDLLRLIFGLGIAAAVLLLWSETFPVVSSLQAVVIPFSDGLTLLGLIKGVLIVAITFIAANNLPGLLELTFLRTTAMDGGTRHAVATLAQYTVIALGLVMLFNVLEIDWAKLGWIAAALSVGIGFGLQEVVANFVCGLIVLFERPIRVGDFVTVDGTTGTVTKIRIRATTITNGDRQDLVVPNKTLITSSILNWTLDAGVNRIIIRLGVAGGTDTERARRILLEVAAEHPLVLDDPAPMATFEQFGASSLDLVLYAYLSDVAGRTPTITDLHTAINKRFTEAGIDIPNPQFDLNVHTEAAS